MAKAAYAFLIGRPYGIRLDIKVKKIAKYEGVYFDMLQQIFTDVTGLYTRL